MTVVLVNSLFSLDILLGYHRFGNEVCLIFLDRLEKAVFAFFTFFPAKFRPLNRIRLSCLDHAVNTAKGSPP